MDVKSSRSGSCPVGCRFAIAVMLVAGVLASNLFLASATAQQTPSPAAASRNDQLFAEARAAKTVEEQDAVLQKLETLRESNLSEADADYLTKLEAWLLHQRGETFADLAAEANARGDQQQGTDLDQKAMEDFHAAISLDPTRWKSYHHRGVGYALSGKFDLALQDFTKTLELQPDYANAWFNRAEIRYELGEYAQAVADYSKAIKLSPNDAGFYTGRGHAYFQLRQFPQALSDYSRAVTLAPDNSEYYANRGDAYRSLANWEAAANDFRQALTRNRDFGRAYQGAAWLMATCPDPAFRNELLAVRSAEKAIELDGDRDYIYLDTLAAALANAKRFDQAVAVQQRAINAAPKENLTPLQQRVALYRSQQPYRQPSAETAQRPAANRKR